MEAILSGGYWVYDIDVVLQSAQNLLSIGVIGLTGFKTAIAAYKAIMGDVKGAAQDFGWAMMGAFIVGGLPNVFEHYGLLFFEKM